MKEKAQCNLTKTSHLPTEQGRDWWCCGPTGVRLNSALRIQAPQVGTDTGDRFQGGTGAVSWNRMDGELHVGWEVLGREGCVPTWEMKKAGLEGWGQS